MKYTQAALDVMTSIQLSSAEPVKYVSKHLGMKGHVVRYHLQGLLADGVLRHNTFINVYPLGLIDHAVFFSLSEASEKQRNTLLRECVLREGICWLAELGGDYQYAIALRVPNLIDVHQAMQSLAKLMGDVFHERAHASRIAQTEFGIRSLSDASLLSPPHYFGPSRSRVEIDKLDHFLLSRLALYPGEGVNELSKACGIPSNTIRYRLARFEQDGIGLGMRYLVDSSKVGLATFRVLIACKGNSLELSAKLKQFVTEERSASHFVECLGSWDYEVQLAVPSFRQVKTFCDGILNSFGRHIHWLRVTSIFDEHKVVAYPFTKPPAFLVTKRQSNDSASG